jgi:hypothetical protein
MGERTRSHAPTFSFRLFSFRLCYEFHPHTADRGTCGARASDCIVGLLLVLTLRKQLGNCEMPHTGLLRWPVA